MSKFTRYLCALAVALAICLFAQPSLAQNLILRVDGINGTATPLPDGSDWGSDAFLYLPDALAAANTYLTANQSHTAHVWVRGDNTTTGIIYKPTQGTNRDLTLSLRDRLSILGGFDDDHDEVTDRLPETFLTVLSGDLAVPPNDGAGFANRSDNSRHVVTAPQNLPAIDPILRAHIDGFRIRGGEATAIGAGIRVLDDAQPTIRGCTITDNHTTVSGAGVGVNEGATLTLRNCTVSANSAGAHGGGVFLVTGSTGDLINSTFTGNVAVDRGGGVASLQHHASLPTEALRIVNCEFLDNDSEYGGGLSMEIVNQCGGGLAELTNCLFAGNEAATIGGGIWNAGIADTTMVNLTIADNTAAIGGGYADKNHCTPSLVEINNTIFGETWAPLAATRFIPSEPRATSP